MNQKLVAAVKEFPFSEGFEGDPTVPGSALSLPEVHSTVCKDNPSTP